MPRPRWTRSIQPTADSEVWHPPSISEPMHPISRAYFFSPCFFSPDLDCISRAPFSHLILTLFLGPTFSHQFCTLFLRSNFCHKFCTLFPGPTFCHKCWTQFLRPTYILVKVLDPATFCQNLRGFGLDDKQTYLERAVSCLIRPIT